jgi:hypothetical protein
MPTLLEYQYRAQNAELKAANEALRSALQVEIANMIADNKAMRGALNVLLLGYKFDDFVEYVNAKKVLQETKTVV